MQKARPYIVVTVIVGLLIGALTVVDSVVRGQAENQVAGRIATSLNLQSPPDVTLQGWPFLVHALTRSFPKAEVTASEITATAGDTPAKLTDLRIVATDIEPDGGDYIIKHIDARGSISYESLSQFTGDSTVTGRDNGRVAITYTTQILGQTIQATVTGVPVLDVDRQEVDLRQTAVEVAGVVLTDELPQRLIAAVAKPVSIRQANVTVQTIEVGADGVVVTATADNLTVSG